MLDSEAAELVHCVAGCIWNGTHPSVFGKLSAWDQDLLNQEHLKHLFCLLQLNF